MFIFILLKDVVRFSEYIASNSAMVIESWIEKGLKISVSGLILIYVVEFSLMDWLKPQESQSR